MQPQQIGRPAASPVSSSSSMLVELSRQELSRQEQSLLDRHDRQGGTKETVDKKKDSPGTVDVASVLRELEEDGDMDDEVRFHA